MNTPVKRTKSTALGKKYNPSSSPIKHRKGHFSHRKGHFATEKDRKRALGYRKVLNPNQFLWPIEFQTTAQSALLAL